MNVSEPALTRLAAAIFRAAGAEAEEAGVVAEHLVDANLTGHDSHGAIRIPFYLELAGRGAIRFGRRPEVVAEGPAYAVLDAGFGFGPVAGLEAVRVGVAKAATSGVALVALRNAAHLGRIGAFAEEAAKAGQVSLHFVNSSGFALLMAPHGGRERRLSASPIAAGFPVEGAAPIVLDIATTRIAEGKVRVARNAGTSIPEGCVIDAEGRPTTDPNDLYGPPRGALLPFGEHKGFGLNVIADLLAGALTGTGCTDPERDTAKLGMISGMLSIFVSPPLLAEPRGMAAEVRRFVTWVKSAAPADPERPVRMPGESSERNRAARRAAGIEIDDVTWEQIAEAAAAVGLGRAEVDALIAGGRSGGPAQRRTHGIV